VALVGAGGGRAEWEKNRNVANTPMAEAVNKNDNRTWRRWIRVPSFKAAWLLSVGVLLTIIVWAFVDVWFSETTDIVLMTLGVLPEFVPGFWTPQRAWTYIGGRIAILGLLAAVGIVANTVVASRLVAGRAGGRSVSSYLGATALAGAWLCLFVGFDDLKWNGFKVRLARQMPEIQSLFEPLRNDWPTKDGALPVVGDFSVDKRDPNDLDLKSHDSSALSPALSLCERFGPGIHRERSGMIQLQTWGRRKNIRCNLEYIPVGLQPTDLSYVHNGLRIHQRLRGSERVGECLYLTWYDTTLEYE
jgi:hypothetical protein